MYEYLHDFKEDEYSWNEVGRRKAKKNSYIRWLIMIVSFIILFISAYLEFRYDLLEINGFLCWLLAILVFSWGFTICYASYVRKHACKMSLEERHDFNLYLYHHKYWKNPILANQALLSSAELIKCAERGVRTLHSDAQLMDCLYDDELTTSENLPILMAASRQARPVSAAIANLYLHKQIVFERC